MAENAADQSEAKSQLLQTALSVVEGYNKWDIEAILAPRAPNCIQQVLPTRLERAQMNNDMYREFFSAIMPLFKGFTATILDTVEDQKRNKVVFHAKSKAETMLGPYGNEYSLIIEMTEDHKKVVSIKEFVDSEYSQDYFPKLKAAVAAAKESTSS